VPFTGGEDFDRLHEWGFVQDGKIFRSSCPAGGLMEELNSTGAVVVGRRTAERLDHGAGIITIAASRTSCPTSSARPVRGELPAGVMRDRPDQKHDHSGHGRRGAARVVARSLHGAQRALEDGVLDEIQIRQIPVSFGAVRVGGLVVRVRDYEGVIFAKGQVISEVEVLEIEREDQGAR
jgi:hypothetical protein